MYGEVHPPAGENGFGWDMIFSNGDGIRIDNTKTLAQMTPEEKNSLPFRRTPLEDILKKYTTITSN